MNWAQVEAKNEDFGDRSSQTQGMCVYLHTEEKESSAVLHPYNC